jgi:hypothetical protein
VSITRVGSNKKFADGWATVFGKGSKGAKAAAPATSKAPKKSAKKKAAKKGKK